MFFVLLTLSYLKSYKYKLALNTIFSAQKMMTELHSPESHHPKHIDYILAVNLITALVLLKVGKLK